MLQQKVPRESLELVKKKLQSASRELRVIQMAWSPAVESLDSQLHLQPELVPLAGLVSSQERRLSLGLAPERLERVERLVSQELPQEPVRELGSEPPEELLMDGSFPSQHRPLDHQRSSVSTTIVHHPDSQC